MRYLSFFLVLLFFSSLLEAAYLRSIRIASFSSETIAKEGIKDLEAFVKKDKELLQIQKLDKFQFKIMRTGELYMVVAEPFYDRKRVQTTLDSFRTIYKATYPKKINLSDLLPIEPSAEKIETIMKPNSTLVKKKQSSKTEVITKQARKERVDPVKKEFAKQLEIQQLKVFQQRSDKQIAQQKIELSILERKIKLDKENRKIEEEKESFLEKYLWILLFVTTFLLAILVSVLLIKSRRKNEEYSTKKMMNEEIIEQLRYEVKTKEKLLSHVSHELRTPITAIAGFTHVVLNSDDLSKVQKDNVNRIESSSQHLLSIINDILDVSKIEAGELKIEKLEFNLNNLLDYALNIISIQAKNNNVDMSMNVDSDVPPYIIGDSLRLGQVLINLLGNAVKFTKDGEVSLGVKQLSTFSDSIKLEFSISDTGIGMTKTQIKNIFQSYAQAEGSTSREFGGTGLGLSISKQLVEMMNGEIKVQSKKDIGTIFTFSILFNLKDAENQRYYRLPSASFLNKRILIVDSINKNIISLSKSFGYFNYKTHAIPSFEETALGEDMKFDLVVINERKLTKLAVDKIKIMQANPNLKLVVTSDIHSNLENKLIQDLRVDFYLRIPFTQQSMLNMLIDLYASKNLESRTKKVTLKDRLKELSGKKILVAEDNELNHKVISGLLSKSGIELTYVLNGQEAVDIILKDIRFDMILMDINMPIMNGYEASVEIRKYKRYDNITIMALSADVMDEAIEKALDSGMQGHISKPIIVDTFYQILLDTLQDSKLKTKEKKSKDVEVEEYEEISISSGFVNCNSDKEFYQSILKDFKTMYGESSVELKNLCNIGNFKEANRIARDIKDVTLNIGAYNLCEISANLEYEFEKNECSNYKSLINHYSVSLKKLFMDIDKYLQE